VSKLRILDFDIENRPIAYLGGDFTTGEVTAIAASWVGEYGDCGPGVHHMWYDLLDLDPASYRRMLEGFLVLYNQADIVTGHYIREHDLPVINGALMELGHGPLANKMTSDTKLDLTVAKHISKSQENLAAMLGLGYEKAHMSNAMWREANRLTPEGLQLTKERVIGDVIQHKAMRAELLRLGLLGGPKVWEA
jgi:hypothetical protein